MTPVWNVLKTWIVLLGICTASGFAGYAIGGVRLASIFAFAMLSAGLATFLVAERALLGMFGARELQEAEDPALHSTVARLAALAGVAKPRLYVIDHGPPLAFSVGRGIMSSSIAMTMALARLPAPAEVEGVLAHELAHVRNRDVVVHTPLVLVAAGIVDASHLGGWLEDALLYVFAPIAAAFEHLLLSPKRELAADRLAADVCGSPHGLADALIRLEQAVELVEFRASPATEPLYTINPFEESGLARMFASHPPVAERVRRLRELDPAWREQLRVA